MNTTYKTKFLPEDQTFKGGERLVDVSESSPGFLKVTILAQSHVGNNRFLVASDEIMSRADFESYILPGLTLA